MDTPTIYALLNRSRTKQVDIMRLGKPEAFRWHHVATCPGQATAETLLRQLNIGAKIVDAEDKEAAKIYAAHAKTLRTTKPAKHAEIRS